jgi:fibronectin type 3 domain-containing protein
MKDKKNFFYLCLFLTAVFLPFNACSWFDEDDTGGGSGGGGDSSVSVEVSPSSATLAKGTTQQFSATVTNSYSSGVTWTVEGNSSTETAISRDGLLSVAGNENSRTFKVKATWSSYGGDTASGTATVTVATEVEIPSNLTITRPGKTGMPLFWSTVNNAANYKVYRSTNGKDFSYLGDTSVASYNDTAVTDGSSYYYEVSAVVNGQETGKSAVVFGFAEEYFALPAVTNRRLVPLIPNQKHYYRFPVTSGEYTITWENGSSQNANGNVECTAWQNDGTVIFTNAYNGYTSPKAFIATVAGYVTVEVKNTSGSNRYNYMAYFFGTSGENDTSVAALPPAPVTGITVTVPSKTSITLEWNSVSDAVSYNIYQSTTQTAAPGLVGSSNSPAFTDTDVADGASYYYTIAPVNADGKEGVRVQGAFAYAAAHYALSTYSSSYKINLPAGSKHYYRLPVSAGLSYTITWENGSSQNANGNVECTAWQNDGTAIFTNAYNGYTSPKAFTATAAGYVTVEVKNTSGSNSYDYQIYYH